MAGDTMTITLTAEQRTWISELVARGMYPSVEQAALQLIDERLAEISVEDATDDLAWAKPLIDAGLADIEAGRVISLEDHLKNMDALVASLTS